MSKKTFKSLKEELLEVVTTIGPWSIVVTKHADIRQFERMDITDSEFNEIVGNIVKKTSGLRTGEYAFKSKKFNTNIIVNLDPIAKQIRLITILPRGDRIIKQGTQKVVTESEEIEID